MPTQPRKRDPNLVGWYVEVPRELYEKFIERYPVVGAKKQLTIMALKAATEDSHD